MSSSIRSVYFQPIKLCNNDINKNIRNLSNFPNLNVQQQKKQNLQILLK